MRVLILVIIGIPLRLSGQPFIELQEIELKSMPALHSGVATEFEGHWVFIGGRTDGLHDFRPPLAFPFNEANQSIWVVDPALDRSWSKGLDELQTDLKDQLSSSNMQWLQHDSLLYIVGGYGWNSVLDSFITFPRFSAVNLAYLIDSIKTGGEIRALFKTVQSPYFSVCGGNLGMLNDTFYLALGHEFYGRYHRKISAGFFQQRYTNSVKRFSAEILNGQLKWNTFPSLSDTVNFHRRDYNLVPQVLADSSKCLSAFSGVFRYEADKPYYSVVDITSSGANVIEGFEQQFAHYHCATIPAYDKKNRQMHTFFIGGSAEFYVDSMNSEIVQDTMIPFAKTISRVTRDYVSDSVYEVAYSDRLPGYLGTNAHFFPSRNVHPDGGVVDLSSISGKTLVGYVVGGIESELPNINRIDVSMSWASSRVFRVFLSDLPLSVNDISWKHGPKIFPNPTSGVVNVIGVSGSFDLFDLSGHPLVHGTLATGDKVDLSAFPSGMYFLIIKSADGVVTQKVLVDR